MNQPTFDFSTDVVARSRQVPVLVDFWAPWCGPCRMLGPVLERLAEEANGRWVLVKVDTDAHPDIASQFGIRGIPDVRLFHHGDVVAQFSGALPEPQVRRWLDEHLPTPKREAMAKAREYIRSGHAAEAVRLLDPMQKSDPGDAELAALTARALVFSNPSRALELVDSLPARHPWEEAELIVREFARLFTLADRPADAISASPLWARYSAAIDELRAEQFEGALIHLISVLQEKHAFDGGHAKSTGLAIFKHLGMRHPTSEKFSRAFSMAVNV